MLTTDSPKPKSRTTSAAQLSPKTERASKRVRLAPDPQPWDHVPSPKAPPARHGSGTRLHPWQQRRLRPSTAERVNRNPSPLPASAVEPRPSDSKMSVRPSAASPSDSTRRGSDSRASVAASVSRNKSYAVRAGTNSPPPRKHTSKTTATSSSRQSTRPTSRSTVTGQARTERTYVNSRTTTTEIRSPGHGHKRGIDSYDGRVSRTVPEQGKHAFPLVEAPSAHLFTVLELPWNPEATLIPTSSAPLAPRISIPPPRLLHPRLHPPNRPLNHVNGLARSLHPRGPPLRAHGLRGPIHPLPRRLQPRH